MTALASCGALLLAAEGPFLRFYHAKTSRYIASRRVFKAQAIHGVCVYAEDHDGVTKIVVWGGRLIRALRINSVADEHSNEPLALCLSNVAKAPDWILDLAPRMSSLDDEDVYSRGICAAVTAHNALLQLTIQYQADSAKLFLDISELTTSSRSILYSAHLLWESSNCIIVAAGTAFGEIMYWSWSKPDQGDAISRIHEVFLGHEGSIFDVRISQRLQRGCCGSLKRVVASCSDDRTIRLWDVSNVDIVINVDVLAKDTEVQRTRHTGFSVAATEVQPDDTRCLAIGWGHTSRVWKVRFLDASPCDGDLTLLSAGEDATSRTWKLVPNTGKHETRPCTLLQINCAAYHNGRNMWSMTPYSSAAGPLRVACGAADSKLTTHPLLAANKGPREECTTVAEYTLQNLLHMAQPSSTAEEASQPTKLSRKVDSVRSYCFVDDSSFLLVTDHGKILIQTLSSDPSSGPPSNLTNATLVDQLDEMSGYSTCTGVPAHGIALVAGRQGNIYMYCKHDHSWKQIHKVIGKVSRLFVTEVVREGREQLALLVNTLGSMRHELIHVDLDQSSGHTVSKPLYVTVSDQPGGPIITSMTVVEGNPKDSFLMLGFRRGSVALYGTCPERLCDHPHHANGLQANLYRVIEKVHGDESVTVLKFRATSEKATVGHLYSVGKDGGLAIHLIDLMANNVQLIHNLALPIGPSIEDLYFQDGHLLVHGFSNKKWVLYDVTSEEEIMGIETGGAHRSWAFHPRSNTSNQGGGGTLVWTRTSSLHVCSQKGSNHGVLRSGGHGREIKAVAVSSPHGCSEYSMNLIATGAEDTDIKIFQYIRGELVCRRTLRKHTTGIQHLQWSDDGKYLFSSAGSEEFYIWRIRALSAPMDIGVVCEFVYTPESEFSDLRIMSFDVDKRGSAYTVAMVFSDSSVKVSAIFLFSSRTPLNMYRSIATIQCRRPHGSL